jgi:NAD(P)-dependent dehydrogenase (short-subunit alcohol dehydrogenase family)
MMGIPYAAMVARASGKEPEMQHLEGRVALVTGGGRGIGRGAALALAELGASVAVLARSADEVGVVADAISARGGRATGLTADVANASAIATAISMIESAFGPIDILINNAAILGPITSTASSDPAAWAQTITINVIGAYCCLRALLPGMLARGWGRIVNISSGAATGTGLLNASAYSTSKAALDMLTRAVAVEVAGSGVTVNALYPGVVDTAMQTELRTTPVERIGAATSERFVGYYERGELGDPDKIGQLIAAMVISAIQGQIIQNTPEQTQPLLHALLG